MRLIQNASLFSILLKPTHLKSFFAKNRFSDYLESFLECGYDDLLFIMKVDESDILEMLKGVGMTKVGHVKVCGCLEGEEALPGGKP